MHRHILVPTLILFLFVLCGGEMFLATDKAYGLCSGCCMCIYGGGYRSCSGCVPPGQYYNGYLCPWCAAPDSLAIETRTPTYNGPLGIKATSELPLSVITRLDPSDRILTLTRRGECMRRSVEQRFLGSAGEGLSLYEENRFERGVQFQIAAQRD
jgi:hypothetical protein